MANPNNHTLSWVKIATDCYAAVRSRRWLIVGVTIVVAVIASIREITLPAYGAETLIVVTPLAAMGEVVESVPETFEPKTYERLLQSTTVMGLVLERLAQEGHFKDGKMPAVNEFSQDLWLHIDLVDQTTRPVSYSPIIRLNAKADTPEMAVAKLQTWADVAIEVGNDALVSQVDSAAVNLTGQRSNLESVLEDVREKLREEKANWNLVVIQKEIELNQDRLDILTKNRQISEQDVDAARKQLEVVQTQLSTEEPFIELRKAPSDDAFWITKEGSEDDPLEGDVMVTQELNTAYWLLKEKKQELHALEAEAEAKLKILSAQIESARSDQEAQESSLAEHEMNQARLEADVTIAQTVYDDIATASAFGIAAQALAGNVGDDGRRAVGLNRVSDRIFPVEFEGVFGSRLTVIIGMLTGFVLITAFVIVREVGIPLLRDIVEEPANN